MGTVNAKTELETLLTINDFAWALYNANPNNPTKKNMSPKEITSLLFNLNNKNVKYILIGGFAMAFHGLPRATGDIDLWIKNTPENMENLKKALIETGIPEANALRDTTQLVAGFSVFSLLGSDFKIDLLHNLKSFTESEFDQCFQKAKEVVYADVPIKVLDVHDLLEEKKSTNRLKDLEDIEHLKRIIHKNADNE